MEIKDYLKVLGKRAWLLIMIPAVAGVVAGLIAVQQPQAFRTTATLQLPHDVTSSPAEVAQLVADFKAAANNPTVQSKVSKDTGLTLQQIRHMNITQVGDSSQLTLGYQTKAKSPTAAKAVILGISSGALDYLAAPESSSTQTGPRRRQRQDQDRPGHRRQGDHRPQRASSSEVQTSTPEDDLKTWKTAGVGLLPAAGGGGRGRGDGEGPGVPGRHHAARTSRSSTCRRSCPRSRRCRRRSRMPRRPSPMRTTERDAAVAKLAAISAVPDLTFSAEGTPVVRKTRVVKTAAAAVVAGFPIAVGVVLLLDALQKRRKNRPPRPRVTSWASWTTTWRRRPAPTCPCPPRRARSTPAPGRIAGRRRGAVDPHPGPRGRAHPGDGRGRGRSRRGDPRRRRGRRRRARRRRPARRRGRSRGRGGGGGRRGRGGRARGRGRRRRRRRGRGG